MNIYALENHKVKLTTINVGYEYQKEDLKKYLKLGKIYTVQKTDVYSSFTKVYLKEVPDVGFNSVCFEDVNEQSPDDDKKHLNYYSNCE